jgi:hypothetical protein
MLAPAISTQKAEEAAQAGESSGNGPPGLLPDAQMRHEASNVKRRHRREAPMTEELKKLLQIQGVIAAGMFRGIALIPEVAEETLDGPAG